MSSSGASLKMFGGSEDVIGWGVIGLKGGKGVSDSSLSSVALGNSLVNSGGVDGSSTASELALRPRSRRLCGTPLIERNLDLCDVFSGLVCGTTTILMILSWFSSRFLLGKCCRFSSVIGYEKT